jgi:hypothetical protein
MNLTQLNQECNGLCMLSKELLEWPQNYVSFSAGEHSHMHVEDKWRELCEDGKCALITCSVVCEL